MASVSYDHDANLASYENYAQSKATVGKNTMPSAPNFEPACILPVRQEMVLSISHHVLNQKSKALNGPTPPPLSQKSDALMWHSAGAPEISSRTTLGDLAEVYFDSVWKNAGRK